MNQKLTAALYGVTQKMEDKDPIKWRLRGLSLDIYHFDKAKQASYSFQEIEKVKKALAEIISLLELASATSFIAQGDFDVLLNAYKELIIADERLVIEEEVKKIPQIKTTEDVIRKEEPKVVVEKSTDNVRVWPQSFSSKNIVDVQKSVHIESSNLAPLSVKAPVETLMTKKVDEDHIRQDFDIRQDKETMAIRQRKIIEYLDNTKSSSIGELMVIFGNSISDKTIQRDLNDLMIQGLVRAEGDKRWRRYFAVHE